jgi:transposase
MQLCSETRAQISALCEAGWTQKEIAEYFKVSQATISKVLKKIKDTGSFDHKRGNGRPKKVSPALGNIILKKIKETPTFSLRKLSKKLEYDHGIGVSHATVRNYLNEHNVHAFSPTKKPLLKPVHVKRRLELAKQFLFMDEEACKSIIFSDESKFNLVYSDGRVSVWRESDSRLDSRNLIPTLKHGGGFIMIWACFSYHGVGRLEFIDGTMDSVKYTDILSRNLFVSAREMGLSDFILQQDNDPKHTSGLAKEFFKQKNVRVLEWPAQSPDINPIETLFGILKGRVAEFQPKNLRELKERILDAWNGIEKELCEKLALSFRKRAMEVVRARGWHIKY